MSQRPAGIPDSWQSRPCAYCGATIWRMPSRFTVTRASYCDQACRDRAFQQIHQARRVTLTCTGCGEEFVRDSDKPIPEQAWCSLECRYPEYANDRKPKPRVPWPVVRLPEDDPRQRIRARFRAVRERWEATA